MDTDKSSLGLIWGIYLMRLRKMFYNFSHASQMVGEDLNPEPTEYEDEMLPTPQWCSVQAFHIHKKPVVMQKIWESAG